MVVEIVLISIDEIKRSRPKSKLFDGDVVLFELIESEALIDVTGLNDPR